MSVTEYEAEFTRLSQYGKHLISTKNLKARRFEERLHPDIRDVILPMRLVTYAVIVDRAMIVERNVNSRKKFIEKKKCYFENFDGKKSSDFPPKKQNAGPSNVGRQNNNRGNKVPKCNTCSSFHSGECRKAVGTCFNCDEGRHMKKNCPKLVRTGANAVPLGRNMVQATGAEPNLVNNQRQGKAFALIPGDVQNTEMVVTGNLFICLLSAYALIDSGSTHSFIASHFAMRLPKKPEPLGYDLIVSQPMSGSICCSTVYRNCDVCFDNKHLTVDVIPIEICHFDVIFGMVWLSTNNATIDCAHKCVEFRILGHVDFHFTGVGIVPPLYLVFMTQA
ncbi:uncharacterized protein LOC114262006 [Camellia sinensis]|uniref:uncharacterized protein LOC114262006 n=1 Tax=Camellia sinensis TaxID=4442 RepID=UPI0010367A48|nr:uncharacterized protein LOC114262006 [Camellia sinensis]